MNNPRLTKGPDDIFYVQIPRYLDGRLARDEFEQFQRDIADNPRRRSLFSEVCFQAVLIAESGPIAEADRSARGVPGSAGGSTDPTTLFRNDLPTAPGRSPLLGFLHRLLHVCGDTPLAAALTWAVMAVLCSGMVLTIVFCLLLVIRGVGVNVHVDGPQVAKSGAQGAGSGEQRPEIGDQRSEVGDPISDRRRLTSDLRPLTSSPSPTVARLVEAYECRWAIGSHSPHPGDDLEPGRKLVLLSGLAEIMFQSGVRTVLQGPATLEVASKSSAFLRQGRLTVTVIDPDARGFEIDTPGMKYTDLGTEFGVFVAKDGAQEMDVFRGQVRAEVAAVLPSPAGTMYSWSGRGAVGEGLSNPKSEISNPSSVIPHASAAPLVLSAGEAVRVERRGKPMDRIAAHSEQFVRVLPLHPYDLPVVNGSFEYPPVPAGGVSWTQGVDGWYHDRDDNFGVNRFATDFSERIPDGRQLCFLNEGQIWQVLPVPLAANTTYVLTFWVGNRSGENSPDYTTELGAGNTVLASADNPKLPAKGHFQKVTLTYVSPREHPALGQPLKIVFRSRGSLKTHTQNIFDDVQLQAIPNN